MKVVAILLCIFIAVFAKKKKCNDKVLACVVEHLCNCPDSSKRAYLDGWKDLHPKTRQEVETFINECPNVDTKGQPLEQMVDVLCTFPKEELVKCYCDVVDKYAAHMAKLGKEDEGESVAFNHVLKKMMIPLSSCANSFGNKCMY